MEKGKWVDRGREREKEREDHIVSSSLCSMMIEPKRFLPSLDEPDEALHLSRRQLPNRLAAACSALHGLCANEFHATA